VTITVNNTVYAMQIAHLSVVKVLHYG